MRIATSLSSLWMTLAKCHPRGPCNDPDVSGLSGHLLERISKYLIFVARHDVKTPATAEGFSMLCDVCRRAPVIRALGT